MMVDNTLLEAAICGDEETFCRLIRGGEDANAVIGALVLGAASLDELDTSHAQASVPGRLAILYFLLETHALSLYVLNAAHTSLKGLTPLGMAAYLNRLDFVTLLLEKGDGLVLIDAVDSQRATPIMYAARDGHTEIVQYLIRHGARISATDCYHRSVLFCSIASPQCLWLCESNIRLERAQSLLSHKTKRHLKLTLQLDASEYISLACMYQQHDSRPLALDIDSQVIHLVTAVASSDPSAVHSLLFPSYYSQEPYIPIPAPVNLPDENGWSPIHYCVVAPRPSTAVLDALYLAGADLTLYTVDNTMTPLHALARFGGAISSGSSRLYAFIIHLVRDLGARLDAIDLNGETCIHLTARYGRCSDVLMAFLECDPDGTTVKIKNNDGKTAYEVAKPEFRSIFERDSDLLRPDSAASSRTVRPSDSSSLLAMSRSTDSSSSPDSDEEHMPEEQFPFIISREKENLRRTVMNPIGARQLLDDLDCLSEQLQVMQMRETGRTAKLKERVDVAELDELLHCSRQNGSELLERFRQLIDAEIDDLHAAQDVHTSLQLLISRLEQRIYEDEEGRRAATPSLASVRRSSGTPSLTMSGSSSAVSLTSLADLAALVTPTGSPRANAHDLSTPKAEAVQRKSITEESEIDFACALSTGNNPRIRRLSTIFSVAPNTSSHIEVNSPLEAGVNLVSIPPVRAPEVRDAGSQLQTLGSCGYESWLDPYVRRANSDILKAHLANLLEIEQMLFGKEDREREEVPSPGSVGGEDDNACWREGVEGVETLQEEDGNFLEMFDGDEEGLGGVERKGNMHDDADEFLDLFSSHESNDSDVEYTPTFRATQEAKTCSDASSYSALDILEIARHELSTVEEAMFTACRSIESAQRYISQAECLTSNIFQKMEHTAQATRLANALNDLCIDEITTDYSRERGGMPSNISHAHTPTTSPVLQRRPAFSNMNSNTFTDSRAFPLPPPPSRYLRESDRKPSVQSLMLMASPFPTPDTPDDEILALRRVLVRKIPLWLDATAYDVDKAGSWVGIVQAIVHNIQRNRL
ncbi:ankyrin [Fomitiporia mediterranea MF3/22]|uniref:ankyrin n=1 Tax=Fomitiporia mediterranea (strain MF3/22) TaxID=694068 RepID=UPI0004409AB7|nr:ankyrin [Fomitiporia mediterranea MF3/22]EJD06435.1 ankyrin [Fomitiporia mediterranea MF3/22]